MFSQLTPSLCFAIFVAAFSSAFQHGYHTGVVNAPQEIIESWITDHMSPNAGSDSQAKVTLIYSIIVSIYCIGGMFGGLLVKFWSGVFGIKWGIFMNNFLVFTSCALMGFSKKQGSYQMLIIGRFLIGLNCGLSAGLVPIYLSEIPPVHLRGGVGSIYQLFITIAILISQIVSTTDVLGRESTWPWLFCVPVIPGIIQILLIPLCKDSPRHLMILGREDEAKRALSWFRSSPEVQQEFDILKNEVEADSKLPLVGISEMFSNPVFKKALIIACMIMIAQQWSGINAVIFYSTSSFRNAKLDQSTAQIGTLLMGAMNVAMTVISTLVVDKAGRKTLLLLGFSLMFIDTVLLCICLRIGYAYENALATYLCIPLVVVFVVFFAIGPGSIPWFLVNELFLPRAKPLAVSFAVSTNWLANFFVGLLFPILQAVLHSYVFLVFASFQIIFIFYIKFYVPETKNRNIGEITAGFSRSSAPPTPTTTPKA